MAAKSEAMQGRKWRDESHQKKRRADLDVIPLVFCGWRHTHKKQRRLNYGKMSINASTSYKEVRMKGSPASQD